jgi:hypothetical protein
VEPAGLHVEVKPSAFLSIPSGLSPLLTPSLTRVDSVVDSIVDSGVDSGVDSVDSSAVVIV